MKNEAILSDRLVISEETSAREEAVRVRVRACVRADSMGYACETDK